MNKRTWLPLFLALASTSLLAAGDTPPSTHLKAGQWAYHSVTTFTSGMMSGRSVTHDWKACVGTGGAMHQALMPQTHGGDTSCSKPTLSHDGTGYRTVMTCTSRNHGITSTIKEDFTLAAADDGTTFKGHGTVDQDLALPSGAEKMRMKIDITGHRTGACAAR